jgi:hypothetical protein
VISTKFSVFFGQKSPLFSTAQNWKKKKGKRKSLKREQGRNRKEN